MRKVHRLVAMAFIPNPRQLPQVNHLNGTKWDNRASNLEWVDTRGNALHAVATGLLRNKGSLNGHSALQERDVEMIAIAIRQGDTHASIAKKFGIASGTVGQIARGETWSWLTRLGAEKVDYKRRKLNHDQVEQIRALLASGEAQTIIAARFGVKQATISDIAVGRTWAASKASA